MNDAEEAASLSFGKINFADIQRVLALFAEGIAGRPLHLKPLDEKSANSYISRITTDGLSIHVPASIANFATVSQNRGAYRIIVLHQIGYLVNGTFDFDLQLAAARMKLPSSLRSPNPAKPFANGYQPARASAANTYAFAAHRNSSDLERFFAAAKRPAILRRVFVTLEDLRIDCAIARDYPGAYADLARTLAHALGQRPSTDDMRPLAALTEQLVQYSLAADRAVLIQQDRTGLLPELLTLADVLRKNDANVYDTARAAMKICALFEVLIRKLRARNADRSGEPDDDLSQQDSLAKLESFSETANDSDQPVSPAEKQDDKQVNQQTAGGDADLDGEFEPSEEELSGLGVGFRGELMPNLVHQRMGAGRSGGLRPLDESVTLGDKPAPDDTVKSDDAKHKSVGARAHATRKAQHDGPRSFLYDEWDYQGSRYHRAYCRVYESRLRGDNHQFASEVRNRHAQLAAQVKRQFGAIKPESWQRVHRTPDGDELGLDGLIETVIDRRTGYASDEHLYVRRDRALREVAAAFLVDMSASTDYPVVDPLTAAQAKATAAGSVLATADSNTAGPYLYGGYDDAIDTTAQVAKRRVIDVAKESLALMCDALHALGDSHAVYGFSGEGRENVEFYVAKEFGEKLSARTWSSLAAIEPRRSTRMGPAIRHAVTKLAHQPMRLKVLIIVSDGYPQDSDYGPDRSDDEYGIQDTARALQEAERGGITTFCITIDPAGHDYLRRMCSDQRYLVIDDVRALPRELTKVYRALTA